MSFDPTFDRVVIEVEKTSEKVGLLYVVDKGQKKADKGKVVAVGPGRWNNEGKRFPMCVRVGDRVMYDAYNVTEFETEDNPPRKMVVLNEGSILGVIN